MTLWQVEARPAFFNDSLIRDTFFDVAAGQVTLVEDEDLNRLIYTYDGG